MTARYSPWIYLDLKTGWYFDPREKTGVKRRAKLWPETIAALQEVLHHRKTPIDPAHAQHVFITKYGNLWETGEDSIGQSATKRPSYSRN